MTAKIEHLIVLMMENRSFDHMLGFLGLPGMEGLGGQDWCNTDSKGNKTCVSPTASRILSPDPYHDFRSVSMQIFGTEMPAAGTPVEMSGFIRSYESPCGGDLSAAANIMRCWGPGQLPVLSTLARQYAVCDHWFSSVPGPTLPNRAFAHAGTSRGRLDMSPDFTFQGFRTIYEFLQERNVTSTIYYHDFSSATAFEHLLFSDQAQFFADYNEFEGDCREDNLASYCFIEPRYNDQTGPHDQSYWPNDQHPSHDVYAGEALIRDLYQTLTKYPKVWTKSILVIVYDEHGGFFDHVKPPQPVAPPDGEINNPEGFRFDRLGVRVPAVIVSPWIDAGVVSKIFDHTSFLGAARRLFTKDSQDNFLSDRDKYASQQPGWGSLEKLADRSTFRTDVVKFPDPQRPLSDMQRQLLDHAAFVARKIGHPAPSVDAADDERKAGAYMQGVTSAVCQRRLRRGPDA